ncbi:hypothetical protein C8F01DRAFT_989354 [Mycena amicta]|nr:hypothetical protein C8F01DRAFT_989354 [Mycena amicta]
MSVIGIFSESDPRLCEGLRVRTDDATDTSTAEYLAAVRCLQLVHPDTPVAIFTKKTVLVREVKNIAKNENSGWIGMRNKRERKALAANLRRRSAKTTFHRLAQPTAAEKDLLKKVELIVDENRRRRNTDEVDLTIPQGWLPRGARLSKMTQSLATTAIRELEEVPTRPATEARIKEVQEHMVATTRMRPPPEVIWRSLRSRDIASRARNFFWKLAHNAFRVGHYWAHIPECGEREMCATCGEEESMEHILFKCDRPGQTESWSLAEELWRMKYNDWQPQTMGSVLGCALVEHLDVGGKPDHAARRLHRILISETAYQIWLNRCNSVIGRDGETLAVAEVHNRWLSAINERLKIDQTLATTYKNRRPLADPKLVTQTWAGLLRDEETLSTEWIRGPGVLVGIGPHGHVCPPPLPPEAR